MPCLLLLSIFSSDAFELSQFCFPLQLPFLHALINRRNLSIKNQILLLEKAPVEFLFLIYSCAFLKLRTPKMKTVTSNLLI